MSYKQSEPFIRLLITVRRRFFGEMERKLSIEDQGKLVMLGKKSVICRLLFGKTENTVSLLPLIHIRHRFSENFPKKST